MNGLLILGAGGHGKVVAEAAASMSCWDRIAFLDDRHPELASCLSYPVIGKFSAVRDCYPEYSAMAIALGDNEQRLHYLESLRNVGAEFPVIIHASAAVSPSASLGMGTVVFAQAAVNAGAEIGVGGIINTAATVDHDCLLGRGVHLSPGVHLGGGVRIGDYAWIGIGAAVIHDIRIGDRAIVGAGSVVTTNISPDVTVAGVPAKPVSSTES